MKILFIIPHYYPSVSFGGPPIVVHQLAKSLAKEKVEVSVFCGDALDSNHRILKQLYTAQNLFAGLLASKSKPFIISPHGSLTESPMRGKEIFKKMFYFISRNVYKKAAKFIALTEKEKKECLTWGIRDEKINIIPNGINSPQTASNKEKINFRKKWKIPDSAQIILYMGRLHPIKHLDLLIISFAQARKKDPAIFLIIAGPDAGIKRDLEYLAKSILPPTSYIFTDMVGDSDKNVLLNQAKISVLTSYSEGLSQFALESVSYGIPLIATRSGGQDFVTKSHCGLEVSENPNDISESIIKLLHKKDYYYPYSKNGKIMAMEKYQWKSVAGKYIELYDSIIRRSIS